MIIYKSFYRTFDESGDSDFFFRCNAQDYIFKRICETSYDADMMIVGVVLFYAASEEVSEIAIGQFLYIWVPVMFQYEWGKTAKIA